MKIRDKIVALILTFLTMVYIFATPSIQGFHLAYFVFSSVFLIILYKKWFRSELIGKINLWEKIKLVILVYVFTNALFLKNSDWPGLQRLWFSSSITLVWYLLLSLITFVLEKFFIKKKSRVEDKLNNEE